MEYIKKLIAEGNYNEITTYIDSMKKRKKLEIFMKIPLKHQAKIIIGLSNYTREFLVKNIPQKRLVSLIRIMKSDDSVDILSLLPEKTLFQILTKLSPKEKNRIENLLKYANDTAGGIMEAEYISVEEDITVKEAIDALKKKINKLGNEHNMYVVNKKNQLKGVVSFVDLLLADKRKKVKEIMNKKVIYAHPNEDKEHIARIFRQKKITSLPIINNDRIILGKVSYDDALKVLEEETSEDFLKMFGSDTDLNIFDPMKKNIKKRFPWLLINLFTAVLAAITVSLFEDTISKVVALAVFMPIVAGMGGNSGSQCLTMATRAIALGQLEFKNSKKVFIREFLIGIVHGAILGIFAGIIALLWKGNAFIGVVLFLAMIINIVVGTIVGIAIPLTLKMLKIDPAVASGVIVTTFTDVMGFLSFLGIATILINVMIG